MFGDTDLKAEIVNGTCPTCDQKTLLVSLTPEFYRCITCGADLEQKINGKISYIPHVNKPKDIKLEVSTTNG
jgi:DNA-directed RNA polymerase subunit RPC12/RpoP|tara:strand:+ start:410 stop:625 length:216 start_codon:yes stop_codon:yes gene_type:complete